MIVAGEQDAPGRIWRAVEAARARALQRLDASAGNAVQPPFGKTPFVTNLARKLARDLTAVGLVVHDSAKSVTDGGVWLGECPDYPAVIATWTQHTASAAVLGALRHLDLQTTMNFNLYEIVRLLGYAARPYGPGGAVVVLGGPERGHRPGI